MEYFTLLIFSNIVNINMERPKILIQVCDERGKSKYFPIINSKKKSGDKRSIFVDYEISEIINGERLSIVGQECLNNGTSCFQNRLVLSEYEHDGEYYENTDVSYTCQQTWSRIHVQSGTHVQSLNIPRGCVCQVTTNVS